MNKKILFSLIMILIMTTCAFKPAYAELNDVKVVLDNVQLQFDVQPQIINGRTMVPMRTIFEKLGYTVYYNQSTNEITASKGTTDIILYPNKTTAIIAIKYPKETTLDVAPAVINGRTLVPLRFVAEAAGTAVNWDNNTRTVSIETPGAKYKDSPYTQEKLKALVEKTEVNSEITEFRNKPNKRREGLNKFESKYFDIYYPKDSLSQQYIDYLSPYADTVYMFLSELYGQQVPVEVHLIRESDAADLREGDIRRNEKVTFVYMNDENTNNLTNALYEMVHEMNHNFFSAVNNDWDKSDDQYSYFVDEGISRIIGAVYIAPIDEFSDSNGNFNLLSLDNEINNIKENMDSLNYYPNPEEASKFLFKTWFAKTPKERVMRDSCIIMWMHLYDTYGPEKFEEVVRTMGQKNFKPKVENIYGITFEELYKELYSK